MSRKKNRDLLDYHREWVDHSYNPGYWINKVSWLNLAEWRFTRRYSRFLGILGLLSCGAIFLLFYLIQRSESPDEEISIWQFLFNPEGLSSTVMFLFGLVVSVALLLRKPEREEPAGQAVQKREKKKKLPKRRKDYK